MREQVITMDRYNHAREQSDDIWDDDEVFDEERDQYPLRELVLEVVEGQFTHPDPNHNSQTVQDSVDGLVFDYVSDALPDALSREIEESFRQDVYDEVSTRSMDLYEQVREESDEYDSISSLQNYLEQQAAQIGIPQRA